MWRTTVGFAAGAALLVTGLAAPAGATEAGGVRVAHNGQGGYIGGPMGTYIIALQAPSPSRLQVSFHLWTTCYPSYETVNGKRVALTPVQQKSFSSSSGLPVPIPNVHLSPNGSFHASETLPGPNGSTSTISGQISGNRASGTFSAKGIRSGGNRCDDVTQAWRASYDSTAEPDPTIFQR
jgi:hypothetical protein